MGYYSAKLMALLIKLGYPIWSDNNVAGSEYMTALESDFTKTFSQTTSTFGSFGTDSYKWEGGVLAPNGKIYCIPRNATTVLEIDPVNQTTATFGSLEGTDKWIGGVLAPNGKIYGIPAYSTTILEIDPVNKTTSTFGSVGTDSYKWIGGVLAPNGKIYGIPFNSTTVLEIGESQTIDTDAVLSRYLNKF